MTKIAMIGAGSTVFMKNLVGDILSEPLLKECEIALMDIDAKRLATSKAVAERIAGAVDARPRISATTDRRDALEGADYVVIDDPGRRLQAGHGHRLRGPEEATGCARPSPTRSASAASCAACAPIPVLLDMCRDMEELCPDALFLNYVNPMAINCWALSRVSRSGPSASATACRARPRSWPPTSACPSRRSTTSAPASTTWRSICVRAADADGERSLSAHPPGDRGRSRPRLEPRPLRGVPALRLLRHRVLASTSPNTCRGSSSATGRT